MSEHLEIIAREREEIVILDLKGRAVLGPEDLELRERLQSLLASGKRNVILNFKEVTDIDTTGIGTLASCAAKFQEAGGRIAFLNLSHAHAQLPEILKLDTLFVAYQDEQDAVNSFFPERVVPHYDILEFVEHMESEKLEAKHKKDHPG
ncbi:MAG TPA: STAS domain-containing protein [Bryobacteraceae bacterium]|nr:STAS domain-containing protein [Bryobacteraceae bacterium]